MGLLKTADTGDVCERVALRRSLGELVNFQWLVKFKYFHLWTRECLSFNCSANSLSQSLKSNSNNKKKGGDEHYPSPSSPQLAEKCPQLGSGRMLSTQVTAAIKTTSTTTHSRVI